MIGYEERVKTLHAVPYVTHAGETAGDIVPAVY